MDKLGGTALIAHGEGAFPALACMCSSVRAAAYAFRRAPPDRAEADERVFNGLWVLAPQSSPLNTFLGQWLEALPALTL
eukprot:1926535-Heterocapsa_arctica.AAC.1